MRQTFLRLIPPELPWQPSAPVPIRTAVKVDELPEDLPRAEQGHMLGNTGPNFLKAAERNLKLQVRGEVNESKY